MTERTGTKLGPICGIALFVAMIAGYLTASTQAVPYVGPSGPPAEIADMLDAMRDQTRLSAFIMLVVIVPLVVFVADLYDRFRARDPAGARVSALVFLVGGVLVAVALLLQAGLWLGMTEVHEFGDRTQAALAVHALSTNALVTMIPGASLMSGAVAVMSLRYRALPYWIGALAIVALVIGSVAYWTTPWMLWVVATSIVLLIRGERAPIAEDDTSEQQDDVRAR